MVIRIIICRIYHHHELLLCVIIHSYTHLLMLGKKALE